jgi:hypothetical protein
LNTQTGEKSEATFEEARNAVTFAVYAAMDDLDQVAQIVDACFMIWIERTS